MTTTAIPDNIREQILEDAGDSAHTATHAALTMWQAGDRYGALRALWNDGADEEWLYSFASKLGATPAEAETLTEDAVR